MYDILIIGGGPAGITAAIYGKRAGKKVLLLEAKNVGGQMSKAHIIDNYPGNYHIAGEELSKKFLQQALDLGIEIKYEKAMSIFPKDKNKVVQTIDNMYEAKAVIIATGNDKRNLGIPGETEFLGRGVSYCATCDGNFFKNKTVAIVGGSEEAIEDCLYLSDLCQKVYFILNKKIDTSTLTKDNIEVLENTKVLKVNGEKKVSSITIKQKEEKELAVDGLFVAIASVPETAYLLNGLDKNKTDNIITKEDMSTNIDGIFVAGDIRDKTLRQVSTAVADGAIAATTALNYIRNLD